MPLTVCIMFALGMAISLWSSWWILSPVCRAPSTSKKINSLSFTYHRVLPGETGRNLVFWDPRAVITRPLGNGKLQPYRHHAGDRNNPGVEYESLSPDSLPSTTLISQLAFVEIYMEGSSLKSRYYSMMGRVSHRPGLSLTRGPSSFCIINVRTVSG